MENKKLTPQVSNILQSHGFILKKGDAAKVAERAIEMVLLADNQGELSEDMIVDAALALKLPHNQKSQDKLSLLAADPLADALTDLYDDALMEAIEEKLADIKKDLLSDLGGKKFNLDNYYKLINKIYSS